MTGSTKARRLTRSGPSEGFPGFAESAPLDLSNLTETQWAGVRGRFVDHTMEAFAETAARVGYCTRPVRLVGFSRTIDAATGEVLGRFDAANQPLGVLYRPCGNRREQLCPSCSRVYARDTFAMIRAGILGGKAVPDTVAENPLLFLTLTAPSFGHVHGPRCGPEGVGDRVPVCPHGRRTRCRTTHEPNDRALGGPLCPDCYDWNSAVVWQWWAPELWRRTVIAMRRGIARALGVPEAKLKKYASLQFAKVAEVQARGLVHFHALLRLDGSDGPGSPAPLPGDRLAAIVNEAVPSVRVTAPPIDDRDECRALAWGRQLDVRVVRDGARTDNPVAPLLPEQVAGYLAKYATKDASSLRVDGCPRPHLARLHATVVELAQRAHRAHSTTEAPYSLLGKWAHMYGFRGHFASKSRRYSITLGRLRRARQRFARMLAAGDDLSALDLCELEHRLLADEEDQTTLVVGSWTYQGTGWPRPGDDALALAAAARARERAQWLATHRPFVTGLGRRTG